MRTIAPTTYQPGAGGHQGIGGGVTNVVETIETGGVFVHKTERLFTEGRKGRDGEKWRFPSSSFPCSSKVLGSVDGKFKGENEYDERGEVHPRFFIPAVLPRRGRGSDRQEVRRR